MKNGFTLLELLVVTTVAALLLLIAAPSFTELVRNNRAATTTNEFLTAITTAKSEAIRRSRPVKICASTDHETCADSGADWSNGWIAFVDLDEDGQRDIPPPDDEDPPPAEELIRVNQGAALDIIRDVGDDFDGGEDMVFGGEGFMPGMVVFSLCDARGADYAKRLEVWVTGYTKTCGGVKSGGRVCVEDELPECGG